MPGSICKAQKFENMTRKRLIYHNFEHFSYSRFTKRFTVRFGFLRFSRFPNLEPGTEFSSVQFSGSRGSELNFGNTTRHNKPGIPTRRRNMLNQSCCTGPCVDALAGAEEDELKIRIRQLAVGIKGLYLYMRAMRTSQDRNALSADCLDGATMR